jgi:Ca2+-binding RTX toxin-like protein
VRCRRPRRRRPRFAVLVVLGLVGFVAVGLTASNVVAQSHAADRTQVITVNTVKPVECNGITLASIIVGTNGNAAANLLLGNNNGQTMTGQGGDDCILGGGGNDDLRGNAGNDVCIGGPGTDTFRNNCETQIQ